MLEIAIRAILAVTVPSCPVVADPIAGSGRALIAMGKPGAKVSLIGFPFPLSASSPFSFGSPFTLPFPLAFAFAKSRLPGCGCPFPNIEGTGFANWITTDVV